MIFIKQMKFKLFILSFLIGFSGFASKDLISDIAAVIKTGNSKEISKYFADNVDLKIIDKEDAYSKSQAELIIKDFFTKHAVKSFTLSHQSTSKGDSQFAIGTLVTANGKYRVYYLLKKFGDKQLIQQFRIEAEDE